MRGELLEREREKEREIVLGYHTRITYYPIISIVKIKRENERERGR